MSLQYSMLIRWSEEDQAYIVMLPEFDNAKTHGRTYEAAVKMGRELIESFIMWYRQDRKPLPSPRLFVYPGHDMEPLSGAGVRGELTIAGDDEDDALPYQERDVELAILAVKSNERGAR